MTISSLFDYKLLPGSHVHPGPDGGTCINELAAFIAGYDYHPITSIHEVPSCFCPTMAYLCLVANDDLPEGERQTLIPYALKLPGSNGGEKVAAHRAELAYNIAEPVRLPSGILLQTTTPYMYLQLIATTLIKANRIIEALDAGFSIPPFAPPLDPQEVTERLTKATSKENA